MRTYKAILVIVFIQAYAKDHPCRPQNFGQDSVVCVCDEDYCDSFDPELPGSGRFVQIQTNKAGQRFATTFGSIDNHVSVADHRCTNGDPENQEIFLTVDRTKTAQTIMGFGGSFSDAVGYNLNRLKKTVVDRIFSAYFANDGLRYNMGRTPIGLSDFSVKQYFYDDTPYDVNMTDWKLRSEDHDYKISYIKKARDMIEDELLLHSSVWTVPEWMREIASDSGMRSKVNPKYYSAYCLYIMKYLEAYKNEGIHFYGVSFANEPTFTLGLRFLPRMDEVMTTWGLEQMIDFAKDYFLPALRENFPDTKLVFFDDNRNVIIPTMLMSVRRRPKYLEFYKKLEVVAFHSYADSIISPDCLDKFHWEYPNATIISTEICIGRKGIFGAWADAEFYISSLMQELNHYTSAFIDWNLLLDMESKPCFLNTNKTAAIMVDTQKNIFYKQPTFYAIGHFSKFMPRGSVKMDVKSKFLTELEHLAVLRPDGYISAVLYNKSNYTTTVKIFDEKRSLTVSITPHSINTIIYK